MSLFERIQKNILTEITDEEQAARDARKDIRSDKKVMGKITPEVKKNIRKKIVKTSDNSNQNKKNIRKKIVKTLDNSNQNKTKENKFKDRTDKKLSNRDEFIKARKTYTDSSSGKGPGKPTEKGIIDYIAKARDKRQGTNANTKANRKAAEIIAQSSGSDYADKITKKYETDKSMARKRGKNQPSLSQVKADIDKRNPVIKGKTGPIPDTPKNRRSMIPSDGGKKGQSRIEKELELNKKSNVDKKLDDQISKRRTIETGKTERVARDLKNTTSNSFGPPEGKDTFPETDASREAKNRLNKNKSNTVKQSEVSKKAKDFTDKINKQNKNINIDSKVKPVQTSKPTITITEPKVDKVTVAPNRKNKGFKGSNPFYKKVKKNIVTYGKGNNRKGQNQYVNRKITKNITKTNTPLIPNQKDIVTQSSKVQKPVKQFDGKSLDAFLKDSERKRKQALQSVKNIKVEPVTKFGSKVSVGTQIPFVQPGPKRIPDPTKIKRIKAIRSTPKYLRNISKFSRKNPRLRGIAALLTTAGLGYGASKLIGSGNKPKKSITPVGAGKQNQKKYVPVTAKINLSKGDRPIFYGKDDKGNSVPINQLYPVKKSNK